MTTRNKASRATPTHEPVSEGDELDQERPIVAEGERTRLSPDPEAPEADALDQAREVEPGERPVATPASTEANEADVWEQSIEVPLDDDRHA